MNYAKKKKASPKRIMTMVVAFVLLAAIVFGIVWSSLDHSYRYDKTDLSQFFADGAGLPAIDDLKNLHVKLETDVTEEAVRDQIETNIKKLGSLNGLKKPVSNVNTTLPYSDIVWMFYEVYAPADEESDSTDPVLLMSNTAYGSTGGATMVRLGSGDLHEYIEKFMLNYPEYSTAIDRQRDEGKALIEGYTLVVEVTGTYKKTVNGEEKTNTFLTLSDYNYQPVPTPVDTTDPKNYYQGKTDFGTGKTNVETALKNAFAGLSTIGESFEITVEDVNIDDTTEDPDITFKGKVTAMFKAETKIVTLDLNHELFNGDFKYKGTDGKDATISKDKDLTLYITVESTASLDKTMVEELTVEDTGFTAPTVGEGEDEDTVYCQAYIDYIQKGLMDTFIDNYIEKNTALYESALKSAVWAKVFDLYAKAEVIDTLPEGELEKYYKTAMNNYKYEYNSSSTYLKTYKSVEEYILSAIYDDKTSLNLEESAMQAALRAHIEADGAEAIRAKILLFALAEKCGVSYDSAAKKEAKNELFNSYFSYWKSYYAALNSYGASYSTAEIERMAKDAANANVADLSAAYLREFIALNCVQDALVGDAKAYTEITWVLEGQLDSEE
ncbi:MAG: hypothetical protein J6T24_00570 [Clostridia bacterium]|nr:hypothetical protein [Clostridia bacterium]